MTNSIIDSSAKIDKSVKIGPFCVIGPDVEIGPKGVLERTGIILDAGKKIVDVRDAVSKRPLGLMPAKNVKQIKPNSGVRAKIASALAPVQLTSDNIDIRRAGLAAISRDIQPSHLLPLQQAAATEIDASLKQLLEKTYKFAVITYGTDTAQIVAAINNLKGDLSLEARAVPAAREVAVVGSAGSAACRRGPLRPA